MLCRALFAISPPDKAEYAVAPETTLDSTTRRSFRTVCKRSGTPLRQKHIVRRSRANFSCECLPPKRPSQEGAKRLISTTSELTTLKRVDARTRPRPPPSWNALAARPAEEWHWLHAGWECRPARRSPNWASLKFATGSTAIANIAIALPCWNFSIEWGGRRGCRSSISSATRRMRSGHVRETSPIGGKLSMHKARTLDLASATRSRIECTNYFWKFAR